MKNATAAITTQTRLANLIKADVDAGQKVECLEVNNADRASLIEEITRGKGDVAKKIKASGIDVALPTLEGVPLRWNAAATKTILKGTVDGVEKIKKIKRAL